MGKLVGVGCVLLLMLQFICMCCSPGEPLRISTRSNQYGHIYWPVFALWARGEDLYIYINWKTNPWRNSWRFYKCIITGNYEKYHQISVSFVWDELLCRCSCFVSQDLIGRICCVPTNQYAPFMKRRRQQPLSHMSFIDNAVV